MCKIFKKHKLQITIEANKKVVDFLDITLDLRTGVYKPYKKPNNDIAYIHKQSNHPPSIIKNLSKGINKRLSTNSNNAQTFKEVIPPYIEALKKSGYNRNLQFDTEPTKKCNENKTRKRKVTWFNPPFNINVATNVAKIFLSLIDKHFRKNNKLCKIFNRNTIKVSYSYLPNVKQTLSNKNNRLLQIHREKESPQNDKLCNCRQKNSCPFDGKCLNKCVVYKATVTETDTKRQETCLGLTENEFKIKLEHKRTTTTLSDHIWKLKKKYTDFNIKWEIIKNVKPYAPGEKICKLCLQEKFSILISKPSLNKRTEIFGHCVCTENSFFIFTPPASQQQQLKYSTNQQLSRLKKEPKGASKLLSHDNDDI